MTKSMPLNSKGLVVKSPRVPAKPSALAWKDFDEFVQKMDELVEFRRLLLRTIADPGPVAPYGAGDLEDNIDWCKSLVSEREADCLRFNPTENSDDNCIIKKAVVSKRLGVLIGSFPNAGPHSPEVYTRMMVEEVAAFDMLDTIILESACREIVRTCKFVPAIAEVLEVLQRHEKLWDKRYDAMCSVEETLQRAFETSVKWGEEEEKRTLKAAHYDLQNARSVVEKLEEQIKQAETVPDDMHERHKLAVERTKGFAARLAELEAGHAAAEERN